MIIATYKSETELDKLEIVPCSIPAEDYLTVESAFVTVDSEDNLVKVFVWENMSALNPLTMFADCLVNK